ncbi:tRNA wybutosine-synthesizing protein 4-like [Diadema setosum]|uniref:tRNA wybutosine-synthesizing protein 4-like n=1 Tax=Diadema setosum TaxID=31175 RepID=UPI003B3B0861
MPGKGDKFKKTQNDAAVQGTNDSSIVSKCSVASLGYFQDVFLKHFVSKATRRAPLINRGYFIRAKAIDDSLHKFLHTFHHRKNQIISLGAGFDSTYFRLHHEGALSSTSFYEIDFPQLVARKAALVAATPELQTQLHNPVFHDVHASDIGLCISSNKYHLLGVDLKNLRTLEDALQRIGIDFTLPTLLLSECVITYIDTPSSDALISWAGKTFQNGLFLSYEQVQPHDPFGIVMQQHFIKLNSPLNAIQTYSTMEKHCARYVQQGWQDSSAINMYQYYSQVLTGEERERVEAIELFDEFEEWHLKCVHYVVVAAFNGDCAVSRDKLFPDINSPAKVGDSSEEIRLPLMPSFLPLWSDLQSSTCLKQFSHASAQVPGTDSILVAGGFGDHNGCHGRLDELRLIDMATRKVGALCPKSGAASLGPRMHHTLTALPDGRFFVFGGRTSPAKPCTDTYLLTLSGATWLPEYSLQPVMPPGTDAAPCARWRHTASAVSLEGREMVCLIGGRGIDGTPLDDTWLMDVGSLTWKELNFKESRFEARHSHTATQWGDSCLVVAGGLGHGCTPLSSIVVINLQSLSLQKLNTSPSLSPRYSHTAHIVHDQLILVGGVNPTHSTPPSLTVVDLTTGSVQYIDLQLDVEHPLMLHNHTSHWRREEGCILVIGGGGNCFSFGTHLNRSPVLIDIREALQGR